MRHIEVVAAIIIKDEKFLCTQRNTGKFEYISYKYEFPGGKVEQNETKEQALIREIKEELDLEIEILNEFCRVEHEYPDFKIILNSFICKSNTNEIVLNEHIDYRWLKANDIDSLDWAEADIPIVKRIREIYL